MSLISDDNKREIFYNLINSFLAGILVFLGSCTAGGITKEGLLIAGATSLIVAVNKFKGYWESEKKEYCKTTLFNFL